MERENLREKSTTSPNVSEVGPGMFMIDAHMFGKPEHLSTYVFTEPIPTLIEPGPTTCHEYVMAGLEEIGLDDLAQIAVTHIHLDHAGGTGTLANRFPRAKVFVQENGARHLAAPERLLASATRIYGEDGMRDLWGEMVPVAAERISPMTDGDQINLGNGRHLDVMYTPGHAKHHMSLVDSETDYVMVGDSVGITYPGYGIVHPTVPPPDIDVELLLSQFGRYRQRQVSALAFAHFGVHQEVDMLLDDAQRRLRLWTEIVADNSGQEPAQIGPIIEEANRADLRAGGQSQAIVERMQARTHFPTEASGLLRYIRNRAQESAQARL